MKKLKIGIYAKWLNTLGGGEKVATVMAETLSKNGHSVDLISRFEIDKRGLEKKMGVDLDQSRLVSWPEASYKELSLRTKKYDLFINSSYLDHLPSKAKHSIYYILFPTPIRKTILGFIKYETILPFLREFLIIPKISSGLKPIEEVHVRGGKLLSEKNKVVISNAPKKLKIKFRIYVEKVVISSLDLIKFYSSNSKLKLLDRYINQENNVLTYLLEIENPKKREVLIDMNVVTQNSYENAIAVVSLTITNFRYFLWNLIKKCLPAYEMALYGSSSYRLAAGLDTYNLLLADSAFTKKWTKRYWARDSHVLYPPIDVQHFKPKKKKNIILSVGRFFVGGHSKRQDILIKVFKEMINEKKLPKNWQLHLVGGVAAGREHKEYVERLKRKSQGYPIYFHFFASFKELKRLYSEAKIYWHAAGFGAREPIELEHFGIAPVEAMAAGCLPVVFRGGGLTETVDEKSGFTWKTLRGLKTKTQKLVQDRKLMSRLSENAQKRAKNFSRERFARELIEIVDNL